MFLLSLLKYYWFYICCFYFSTDNVWVLVGIFSYHAFEALYFCICYLFLLLLLLLIAKLCASNFENRLEHLTVSPSHFLLFTFCCPLNNVLKFKFFKAEKMREWPEVSHQLHRHWMVWWINKIRFAAEFCK